MTNYIVQLIHIDLIRPGDTISIDGNFYTVCRNDLKKGFMGTTLRGDNYKCGTIPVKLIKIKKYD